ncbi:MAG: FG-GAP-like repeat-containing protein [Micromonosporaceae bacterium]
MRTETQEVFANPSGVFTLEQHARPVRVRGADGSWSGVNTALRLGTDGTVSPVAVPVGLTFSAGGTGPLVRIRVDNQELALRWAAGSLPPPVLTADTATYAEVLPGVDLHVRADVDGFSQVLEVKSAAAAANPALSHIGFGVALAGLTLRLDPTGNITAVDTGGAVVFQARAPRMWDSLGEVLEPPARRLEPASGARIAAADVELTADGLAVVPAASMFSDPSTKYPVFIDPSFAATRWAWAPVSQAWPNDRFYNSGGLAKSGHYHDNNAYPAQDVYRSFFRMRMKDLRGKQILSAKLRAYEVWAPSCSARPVELWLTGGIGPATTWNNQPSWTRRLSTVNVAKGNRAGGCDEGGVDFAATSAVVDAARGNWPDVTLGLRASDESDPYGWKKFRNNPVLEVDYNTPPAAPVDLVTDPRKPCVTGAGRPYVGTGTPYLRAMAPDADGHGLTVRFYWQRVGTTTSQWLEDTNVAQGEQASVRIPAGQLAHNVSYRWWAVSRDSWASSPVSQACEFTVDLDPPGEPTVTWTDSSQASLAVVGSPVGLTFTPAAGDTDVVGYRFGVNDGAATPSIWVPANQAGGVAVWVPVTPARAGANVVAVVAVDKGGAVSEVPDHLQFVIDARDRTGPAPRVGRDVGGDGRADLTAVYDEGLGYSTLWTFTNRADGTSLYSPTVPWDPNSVEYPVSRTRSVAGDFDGDGRSDVAVFRDEGNDRSTLRMLRSDGNAYPSSGVLWDSGTACCWAATRFKLVAGDFNADGRDDIAALVNAYGYYDWYVNGDTLTWVWLSTSTTDRPGFAAPEQWGGSLVGDWNRMKPAAGDFNSDGRADIAYYHDEGDGRMSVHILRNDPQYKLYGHWYVIDGRGSTCGCHGADRVGLLAGDFNGDGWDDVLVATSNTDGTWTAWVYRSVGSGAWIDLQSAERWRDVSGVPWSKVKPFTADVNGDGLLDVAWLHDSGGVTELWTMRSLGTSFDVSHRAWRSASSVPAFVRLTPT